MVLINFELLHKSEGAIQLKLKFEKMQQTKRVLIWVPVLAKKLVITKDNDVSTE